MSPLALHSELNPYAKLNTMSIVAAADLGNAGGATRIVLIRIKKNVTPGERVNVSECN